MQLNLTPAELSRLRAQITALEDELAFYGFKYGLTEEARRLLAARLNSAANSTRDR